MNSIGVVLAIDQGLLRAGVRLLINAQRDMEVMADVASGADAVTKAIELGPAVVILGISIPPGTGVQTIEAIKRRCPHTNTIVLSMRDDPVSARTALAAGALGYILTRSADTELLSAIRSVSQGRSFVDSSLGGTIVKHVRITSADSGRSERAGSTQLSPREREVLRLLAAGHTNREAADSLLLSVKTVETYRARLARKFGLKRRADLTRFALEMGLLTAS